MVTSQKMHLQVAVGNTSSILRLIAKLSIATHKRLPIAEQTVRSVEDLIAEGRNHLVTHVVKEYNPRKTKFITLAQHSIQNYYTDILRTTYRQKRTAAVFSLDTTMTSSGISLKSFVSRNIRFENTEDDMINRIDAERAYLKAYELASPLLRRYMIRWLLQPNPSRVKPGQQFNDARKEFRKVVKPTISYSLCKFIQDNDDCRTAIADKLVAKYRTPAHKSKKGFSYTEEASLVRVVSHPCLMSISIG